MTLNKIYRLPAALLVAAALIAAGCSKSDDTVGPGDGTGTLRVSLTDAPNQNVEAVNLVITRVEIHSAGANDATGWTTVDTDSTVYNLIALRNGVTTTLALADVPVGNYNQVRLVLGQGSTVVVDGVEHPLTVPSGQTSGVKVNGNFNVADVGTQEILIDWDAGRSVHQTGNGSWMMSPVVRLVVVSSSGRIMGTVQPGNVTTTIMALTGGGDTVQTTVAAAGGSYTLAALPPGTYNVAFRPDTGWRDTSLTGIAVTAGATTTVDTLSLTAE